jgi:peroxiredoxin Q/BCP
MLEADQPAPEFALPNHDGETVRLSDFDGERVVLYFYPKAGTSGCTIEANDFSDSWEAFRERDVQVLGVSTDPVDDITAFRDDQEIPFPLLSDEDGSVARRYETFGTPDVDGESVEIAFRNTYVIGPDGEIEAVYEGVSPEGHAKEILDDIDELPDV